MKVLLVAPPWREVYGRFASLATALNLNPPLNLGCLAATLRDAGHEVLIRDLEIYPRDAGVLARAIDEFKPRLVGITATTPMLTQVARIAEQAKAKGCAVVVGGPHATLTGADIYTQIPYADYAIAGEAEHALPELVHLLESGVAPNVNSVPSLITHHSSFITPNSSLITYHLSLITDLDALPDSIYPGVDFRDYLWSVKGRSRVPTRTLLASRGCPYRCVFCSIEGLTGREVRYRSPERVVSEIESAVASSPARHFVFVDDVFTLAKKRVLEICGLLLCKNLPITWEADTRADRVDAEILTAMSRAGCTRINFGIESGDEGVLRSLGKELDLVRVAESFRLAKQAGMDTRGTAMIGNPGDTRDTIRKTVRFLRRLRFLDQPYLSIAQPYPGTKLREMALRGEGGLRIVDDTAGSMRRYGSAVMWVGDISPEELIRTQRRAIFTIYLTPRRILYNLFRADWRDGASMAWRLVKSLLPRGE